jgi:outer membrane protein OmpA-like peptidoglycan-associated protein
MKPEWAPRTTRARTSRRDTLARLLLVLGVADLIALNGWLVPAIVAEGNRVVPHVTPTRSPPTPVPECPTAHGPVIPFDFDKDTLPPSTSISLRSVVRLYQGCPHMEIIVNGHTDCIGGKEYNLRLSIRRASAVAAALHQEGVPAEAVLVHGYGYSQPVDPRNDRAARAANRRVEIIIQRRQQ